MSGATRVLSRPVGLRRRGGARVTAASQSLEHSLLLTATLCLLAFGVVMVFSASSTTSLLGDTGDGAYYLKRTLLFGAIGLVAMHALSRRGLQLVRTVTPALLAVSLFLLLVVMVPGVGESANGAQRWIGAGPIQIQPSEIAKIALILYGAHLLALRPHVVASVHEMGPYLLVTGTACGLILVEPDLGTALVAGFAVAALLVAGGAKIRHLALIGAAIALIAVLAIAIEPYRQERLAGFLNPGADATGAGFQGTQASIALGSGGVFGVGIGESVQKAFYLPEAHTDMIAAVIGEELGLLGIGILVGLYGLLAYAGLRVAQRARDRYAKLLAAGLTTMILVQATLNLFAVLGLAPLTGVPLPFVSYGNSSLIVTLAAVGLVLNAARGGTAPLPATRPSPARRRPRGRRAAPPRAAPVRGRRRAPSRGGRLQLVDGDRGRGATRSSRRTKTGRGNGGHSGGRDGGARRPRARGRRRAPR